MFVNKLFIYLTCANLKKENSFDVISPTYYFHMKTKILADFEICINVPLKQCRLGNNLPTHIRENTDFPRQRPRQLPSAKVKFEGCFPKFFLGDLHLCMNFNSYHSQRIWLLDR